MTGRSIALRSRRRGRSAALPLILLLMAGGAAGQTPAGADVLPASDRRAFADGLLSRGFHDLALPEYAALAVRTPPPPELDAILFRLAECQRKTGRTVEAEATYRRLAREFAASPYAPRARLQSGLLLLDQGRHADAAAELDALAGSRPPPEVGAAAVYYAGDALLKAGKQPPAIARFETVRRDHPGSETAAWAGLRLVEVWGGSGDAAWVGRARALCAEIAAKPPSDRLGAEALYQSAVLAGNGGDHVASADLYRQLATRYPADPRTAESARQAGWANLRAGRPADALQTATKALAAGVPAADRPEWLYLKANAERQMEKREEAIRTYDQLLTESPASSFAPAARYERLLTRHRSGQHAEVLAEAAAFTDPPAELADDLLWLQAEAAEAMKDSGRATQFYRLLVTRHPQSGLAATAGYRLGHELQRQKVWVEASKAYLEVVERHPTDPLAPRALFASATCLAAAGRSEEALRDWHALLTRFPDHEQVPETLYQKAMEEIRRNDGRSAAATLDELLRRFPKSGRRAEGLFWRAGLYRQANDLGEAEKSLVACLAANPDKQIEREARYLLGLVLQQTGREGEAATLFQPLLAAPMRDKFPPDRLCWLAEFQHSRGAWPEAESAGRALAASTNGPAWVQAGWALTGRALRSQGKKEEALAAFRQALAAGSQTRFGAEAALRVGELLLEAGKPDEADAALRDAATRAVTPELLSIRAHAYTGLARAAEARGNSADAIRYHLSVPILFNDPALVPSALDRAATLLQATGRPEESRATVAELMERYPDSPEAKARRAAAPAEAGGKAAP